MEDYKKKYEYALSRASYIKDYNTVATPQEVAELLFPELKENDDERIRKEIKEFILWTINRGSITGWQKEKSNSWIAWLEKQGELPHWKKSILSNDTVTGFNSDYFSYNGYYINYKELFNKLPKDNFEKQGEQKPTDKVEQEKDAELTDFESALFSAFSDAWQEYLSGKEVNVAKWAREHSAELLEVAREQKPAWSEEDENMIRFMIEYLERLNRPTGNSCIKWLKSLKERMKGE